MGDTPRRPWAKRKWHIPLAAAALVTMGIGATMLAQAAGHPSPNPPVNSSVVPVTHVHGKTHVHKKTHAHAKTSTSGTSGNSAATSSSASPQPAAPAPVKPGVHIVIPAIGVDAHVVSLGLTGRGTLQPPPNFTTAGWWSGGPFPGQPGAAVVVGHVASVAGPGVFYRLGDLSPGDKITVDAPGAAPVHFHVTRSIQVPKSNFPTTLVYGPEPAPELRLITCSGPFNSSTHHFLDNLIVFATLTAPGAGAA